MSDPTIVDDRPSPVEVLIQEARHHQHRRYRRSAVIVSFVALLVGGLIALLITITSSEPGTSRGIPKTSAVVGDGTTVLIRPVLCFAPAYAGSTESEADSLPVCPAPYELTTSALNVTPMGESQGYSSNNIAPYPALAGYPNSIRDSPNRVVLLGIQPRANGGQRYLLGPSAMRLSATNVESAVAQKIRTGQWVVTIHLTSNGAASWDRVAQQSFHEFLAIDVGGTVVSAPIIQPAQSSFSPFDGAMEISGALNASTAQSVAADLEG